MKRPSFPTLVLMSAIVLTNVRLLPGGSTVDLTFEPSVQVANVSNVVDIDIVAIADGPSPVDVGAIDAILNWDPTYLQLLGVDNASADYAWFVEGFLADPDGINTSLIDGDAIYTALSQASTPALVPPATGLLVTTVQFLALAETPATSVSFAPSMGTFGETRVLKFEPSNVDITGDISDVATVEIVPEPASLMILVLGACLVGHRGLRRARARRPASRVAITSSMGRER